MIHLCTTKYFNGATNSFQQNAAYVYAVSYASSSTDTPDNPTLLNRKGGGDLSFAENQGNAWPAAAPTAASLTALPKPADYTSAGTPVSWAPNHGSDPANANQPANLLIDHHVAESLVTTPPMTYDLTPLPWTEPTRQYDFEMIYSFEKYSGYTDWSYQMTYPWENNANYTTNPTQMAMTLESGPVLRFSMPKSITNEARILTGREYWFYLTSRNIYGLTMLGLSHIKMYCADDAIKFTTPPTNGLSYTLTVRQGT